jgi:uncharacterized repeat protein (TIGR03803 family)
MKFALTLCLMLTLTIFSYGQAQEKVLYSFGSVPNDGLDPTSALVSDSAGNLYGTAENGGTGQGGTIFELAPQSDGTWGETTIYNFCSLSNCDDGFFPEAGLVFDAKGNLYGTTTSGGSACANSSNRCGVAFELSPPPQPGSNWTLSVLYNFCSNFRSGLCLDGYEPTSQLIFDASGNLYGTTSNGSVNGNSGLAFELSPGTNGWTETILYNFCSIGSLCKDGYIPHGLTFDASGNLVGTTAGGGRFNKGLLYKLTPVSDGWAETVVFNFYGQNGGSAAPVTIDAIGNLYDTTQNSLFQANIERQQVRTRDFTSSVGYDSKSGVLIDLARNVLHGTTSAGGANSAGTVWEVNVQRQIVPIYTFCSQANCADGGRSQGNLLEDSSGNLYGTAPQGGAYSNGVVFKVIP